MINEALGGWIVFAAVLLVVHVVQGITGFGGIVLALPVLTFFFPIKTLIPALILVNAAQALYYAVAERRHIQAGPAKSIIGLSLLGMPAGYALYSFLPAEQLKLCLGVFVVFVALWNLSGIKLGTEPPRLLYHLLNFMVGLTQGALGSGGPFLVIYTAKMIQDKSQFRATLSLVWAVLDLLLFVFYLLSRSLTREMAPLVLVAMPVVILATWLGFVLHDRIPQKPFRTMVFAILLISGLILLKPLVW